MTKKPTGIRKSYYITIDSSNIFPLSRNKNKVKVWGYVIGLLAVRNTLQGWVVDHLPSGYKLPWFIDTRTQALCFALEIQANCNFNFKNGFSKKAMAQEAKTIKIAKKWGIIPAGLNI
jgi:hypothetical protein